MASVTELTYKDHWIIITKQYNVPRYNLVILNPDRKIISDQKDIELPLRKVKNRAKDFIGL